MLDFRRNSKQSCLLLLGLRSLRRLSRCPISSLELCLVIRRRRGLFIHDFHDVCDDLVVVGYRDAPLRSLQRRLESLHLLNHQLFYFETARSVQLSFYFFWVGTSIVRKARVIIIVIILLIDLSVFYVN